MKVTEEVKKMLLAFAKEKKIYLEGNILKILTAEEKDKEFAEYLETCKVKDSSARKKRLQVTKQVQKQNKELVAKEKQNDTLMQDLKVALEEAKRSEEEAQTLREEAEQGKEQALEDLELMQKKTQFELVGTIVRIALAVIVGVGIITSVMYGVAIVSNYDTQIIGSTWSNMFGILLTNAFSIVGTIMGVKYATEKE
jgi:Fe2+ transport system protein B